MRPLTVAIKMTIVLTVLTGLLYPLVMVGIAHVVFPSQAKGSLIVSNGQVVGSSLIGQRFGVPRYFHSRPSAAGDKGYDASASSGSNLGPTNKVLIEAVKSRLKGVLEKNPGLSPKQVPIDLVTTSGSGLDPEISPAAADIQVARIAKVARAQRRAGAQAGRAIDPRALAGNRGRGRRQCGAAQSRAGPGCTAGASSPQVAKHPLEARAGVCDVCTSYCCHGRKWYA